MISLDEKGKQCPIPIVDTKKALEPLGVGEVVETVVDNEISAQNLKKFADQRQYAYEMEKVSDTEYRVRLTVTEAAKELQDKGTATFNEQDYQACGIPAAAPQGYIVVISGARKDSAQGVPLCAVEEGGCAEEDHLLQRRGTADLRRLRVTGRSAGA